MEDIADSSFVPSKIPDGCTPIHLNLVVNFFFHLVCLVLTQALHKEALIDSTVRNNLDLKSQSANKMKCKFASVYV